MGWQRPAAWGAQARQPWLSARFDAASLAIAIRAHAACNCVDPREHGLPRPIRVAGLLDSHPQILQHVLRSVLLHIWLEKNRRSCGLSRSIVVASRKQTRRWPRHHVPSNISSIAPVGHKLTPNAPTYCLRRNYRGEDAGKRKKTVSRGPQGGVVIGGEPKPTRARTRSRSRR